MTARSSAFLWGVADLIRDAFRRGRYQDVILPLTVLRRLDCVLADTEETVLKRQAALRNQGLEQQDAQLRRGSGFAFSNTSRYDFDKLLADAPHLAANLRNYIAGFSPNMREGLEKFDFEGAEWPNKRRHLVASAGVYFHHGGRRRGQGGCGRSRAASSASMIAARRVIRNVGGCA
ncbi:MAG: hypothetical protein D6696_04575 [Acidobacteria bacterium]|nr:MAG: hypothetical protein D6696_04575 [Acidobacteriota bacterium]